MYARYDDVALLVHRRRTVRAASATTQCMRLDTNVVQPACARCYNWASLLFDFELRVDPAVAAAQSCAAHRPAHRAIGVCGVAPPALPLISACPYVCLCACYCVCERCLYSHVFSSGHISYVSVMYMSVTVIAWVLCGSSGRCSRVA